MLIWIGYEGHFVTSLGRKAKDKASYVTHLKFWDLRANETLTCPTSQQQFARVFLADCSSCVEMDLHSCNHGNGQCVSWMSAQFMLTLYADRSETMIDWLVDWLIDWLIDWLTT